MANVKTIKTGLIFDPQSADPSGPSEGQVQFSDGTAQSKGLLQYKDGSWSGIGGGAGDADTVHLLRAADSLVSDFTIANNTDVPTYAGSVGLTAVFEIPTSGSNAILSNDNVHKVFSLSNGVQYEGKGIVLAIDHRARGTDVLISCDYRTFKTTGDSSNGDYQLHIYDKTNSTLLTDALTLFPANDSDTDKESKTFKKYVQIPETCAEIVYFVQQRTADTDTTIFFDNILVSTNPFQKVETQGLSETIFYDGYLALSGSIVQLKTQQKNTTGKVLSVDNSTYTKVTALEKCSITAHASGQSSSSAVNIDILIKNSADTILARSRDYAVVDQNMSASLTWEMEVGDYVVVDTASTTLIDNKVTSFSVTATPQKGTSIIVESEAIKPENVSYTGYTSLSSTKVKFSTLKEDSSNVLISHDNSGTETIFTALRECYVVLNSNFDSVGVANHQIILRNAAGTTIKQSYQDQTGSENYYGCSTTLVAKMNVGDYAIAYMATAPYDSVATNFSIIAHPIEAPAPLYAVPTITVGQNAEQFHATDAAIYASANTALPYFANEHKNTISNLGSITNDSTSGCIFTATARCKVTMAFWFAATGASEVGISKNASDADLDVSVNTVTEANVVALDYSSGNGESACPTFTGVLEAGDFVACHLQTGVTVNTSGQKQGVTILVEPELGQQNHAAIISAPVAYVKDKKTSGTDGGTFTLGAWRTRDLNDLSGDIAAVGVTLASNQFTLQAGKYDFDIVAPAFAVNSHTAKLYNITDSLDVEFGNSGRSTVSQQSSTLYTSLTITKATTFEVQHSSQSTTASNGFGVNVGGYYTVAYEIYTQVKITRKA